MSVLFIILPAWIGIIWVELLKIKGSIWRFLNAWVLGFATMLAAGQIVLVPLVALQQTLTMALMLWQIVLTGLALLSFYLVLRRMRTGMHSLNREAEKTEKNWTTERTWTVLLGTAACILILLQAYIPARYEHRDDDDSRFVSEEVSAVVHDTMYQDNPITSDFLYWNEGEVRKDFTSPWAMYVAMCSKISNLHPAELSHTYLPFFLILTCYVLYLLIGNVLFKNNAEKTALFLIFLSVIHLWGYTSTHTLASMLLLRIWQGKALCASFIIPLFFYVMYQIMRSRYQKGWIAFLYIISTAACLLSGIGIVTAPVLLLLYGIVDFIYYRKWRKTFAVFMAAVPCGIFLGYYLIG